MKRTPITREESERISGLISQLITERTPQVEFSEEELNEARGTFSDQELGYLRESGRLNEDFELFLAMQWLSDGLALEEAADQRYVRQFFQNGKKFDVNWFYDNQYIRTISVPEHQVGRYRLTNAEYGRGEFFQYDIPDFSRELVVPKLGFFNGPVSFPSIYEGRIPWMSVCPSEIFSMERPIQQAHGRVLVLVLG